ncbi:PREDICTED: bombyxin A-3 homolog [Nicrophorus vespilloides]|uniref:Bombyxin A-3 homolog n=1 Tax=Nicrophorus vespilloides TaxID=110193 RepID=A0ABM1NJK0_NICVS|nr:PREDICTED: bombyxin A-3 homolog [Nicrophorus vespilloides]
MGQEVLLILIILVGYSYIQCYPTTPQLKNLPEQLQVCGSYLATAISVICDGKYNPYKGNETRRNILINRGQLQFPFKRKEETSMFLRYKRHRREGVSDECCKKPCTQDELRTFCL